MRHFGLAVACLALLTTSVLAQQPPKSGSPIISTPGSKPAEPVNLVPAFDPKNNRLDFLLQEWEDRMKKVESIWVPNDTKPGGKGSLKRTEVEKDGTSKIFTGEARYLKPNLASLYLTRQDNPNIYELYINTGTFFYEYRPQQKVLRIHDLPPAQAGQFQNNFLSFLFGMNAIDAKRRYDLSLTQEKNGFIYINILPRFPHDKAEFMQAQLVLTADNMLPRRLWFLHTNGKQVTWDVPTMDTTMKLAPKDFTPPDVPTDPKLPESQRWRKDRVKWEGDLPMSPKTDPRIIRPSSK